MSIKLTEGKHGNAQGDFFYAKINQILQTYSDDPFKSLKSLDDIQNTGSDQKILSPHYMPNKDLYNQLEKVKNKLVQRNPQTKD